MSEHREEFLDLCAASAHGSLDPVDQRRLDEHLSEGCPVCEAALADFSAAVVQLASSAPAATPSASLRGRVLPAARAESPARVVELKPRRASTALSWGLAAAAATLLVATALTWIQVTRLREELEIGRDHLARLQQQVEEERRWAAVLSSPDAKQVAMATTPAGAPALCARATYDPASHSAVLVFENFRAPTQRDYELWAIRGGKPAALGVIHTDAAGRAVMRIEDAGDPASLNAFAVSLEPEGGAPTRDAPTGPVVMVGRIGG